VNPANASIHATLKNVFGFDTFREGQETVITKILEGKSALAVFPTGSGKSLCYQLSALHLEGLTLVISPLIALMKDQIDFLDRRNIPAARLDSTLEPEEIRRVDSDLRARRLKLLYVAPERFSNERFVQKLRQLKISLMVIDEAHCISEWGHNFRPDYLKLARLALRLKVGRVLTLTATATPAVARDICREFSIHSDAFIHTGFHRPNLRLEMTPCRPNQQIALLLSRLRDRPRGPTIVYVTLQRTAETVANELSKSGFPARAYHAGMANDKRTTVQDWFMNSSEAIVVATIAFGMGIDKSDIRYVYHYNLPKSLENYSQEIGRAGRDGKASICEMFACGSDVTVLENFTFGDTPDGASVGAITDRVLTNAGDFDVSVYELSRDNDVRPLVVETLLTYLELADIIEATEPFYNEYQFTLLRPTQEILARFDPARAEFLGQVFATAVKAEKWFTLDLGKVIGKLRTTRSRVVKALSFLEEQGELALKVAGLRQGYRIKKRPDDPLSLKNAVIERFAAREQNDVNRVHQVVGLAEDSECLVRHLLHHFGEELERNCGHCCNCLGTPNGAIRIRREREAPDLDPARISDLRRRYPDALASPRQIARFLCGLSSPLLTRTKLHKHPDFGDLAGFPFPTVLKAADRFVQSGDGPNRTLAA
jgi:ATP-dependent DNA helicase RecQ